MLLWMSVSIQPRHTMSWRAQAPCEPPPFVFKAMPAPSATPRLPRAAARRKSATAVQPFQLSTDVRPCAL